MEFLKNLIDYLMMGGTVVAILVLATCLYIQGKEARRHDQWQPRKR